MPRFFDDYSNTYLTHDSAAGRKQQRRGWKFRENFKLYYEQYLDEWRAGPMGLAAAQQGYLRNSPPGDPNVPPLPEGWKEEVDEATGINFYIHEESGKRTWVRPNFRPPPAGPPMGGMRGPPPPGFTPIMNRPPPGYPPSGPPPPMGAGPPPGYPSGPPPPMNTNVPPPNFTNLPAPPMPNAQQPPPGPPPPPANLPPPPPRT